MSRTVFLTLLILALGQWAFASYNPAGNYWYRLFQKKEFDIDRFLETSFLQLQAENCHYKSLVTSKNIEYQGFGACLYESFAEGLSTRNLPGVITAQLKDMRTNKDMVLIVAWRPAQGGFFHIAGRAIRDWRRKPEVGATDTMMGTLVFDFSATAPEVVSAWFSEIQSNLPYILRALLRVSPADLAQIRITAHPRPKNEVISDAVIGFYSRENRSLLNVYWDWNFFLIPPSRDFTFSAGILR